MVTRVHSSSRLPHVHVFGVLSHPAWVQHTVRQVADFDRILLIVHAPLELSATEEDDVKMQCVQ